MININPTSYVASMIVRRKETCHGKIQEENLCRGEAGYFPRGSLTTYHSPKYKVVILRYEGLMKERVGSMSNGCYNIFNIGYHKI